MRTFTRFFMSVGWGMYLLLAACNSGSQSASQNSLSELGASQTANGSSLGISNSTSARIHESCSFVGDATCTNYCSLNPGSYNCQQNNVCTYSGDPTCVNYCRTYSYTSVCQQNERLVVSIQAPGEFSWPVNTALQLRSSISMNDGAQLSQPITYKWTLNDGPLPNDNGALYTYEKFIAQYNHSFTKLTVTDAKGRSASSYVIIDTTADNSNPGNNNGSGANQIPPTPVAAATPIPVDPLLVDPSVFNASFYMNKYPEVAAAVGYDPQKAAQHWSQTGCAEGRLGIRVFNVKQYIAMYPDEGEVGDWVGITKEYVANGRDAGNAGLFALRSEVFSVDSYLYYNPELQDAFGSNRQAALKHWLNSGINEGRQASDTFKVSSYLEKNPDVAEQVNYNNVNAIRNYILSGIDQGRDGSP